MEITKHARAIGEGIPDVTTSQHQYPRGRRPPKKEHGLGLHSFLFARHRSPSGTAFLYVESHYNHFSSLFPFFFSFFSLPPFPYVSARNFSRRVSQFLTRTTRTSLSNANGCKLPYTKYIKWLLTTTDTS